MSIKVNLKDVKFEYFNRNNKKGGQKQNKTSSAVRAKHIPSGIVIEVSSERNQSANKKLAIENLQTKLDNLAIEAKEKLAAEAYDNKSEASFSSQIRTYRLCGNQQGVTDHRTGVKHSSTKDVLDGKIDIFLPGGNTK